jgi:hypothetical protein
MSVGSYSSENETGYLSRALDERARDDGRRDVGARHVFERHLTIADGGIAIRSRYVTVPVTRADCAARVAVRAVASSTAAILEVVFMSPSTSLIVGQEMGLRHHPDL